jgi:hypothetical protein
MDKTMRVHSYGLYNSQKFAIAWILCVMAFSIGISGSIKAHEFRIESHVYIGESTQPATHNVTVFSDQLAVDFLMPEELNATPNEMVIYDSRQRVIVLLDTQREIRVELSDVQLRKLVDSLRRQTLENETAKFLANDSFEVDTDWSAGWVTLTSPVITYRFRGEQPKNGALIPVYFEMMDVLTQLNATDPRQLPPFPRMKLNQTIRTVGWVPREVQISVSANDFFPNSFTANSRHLLTEGLSNADRELVASAKENWMKFKQVDLKEYRNDAKTRQPIRSAAKLTNNLPREPIKPHKR